MINYIAVSQAGMLVATDDKTIGISNFVDLGGLSIVEITDNLPDGYASRFSFPHDGVARPTEAMWKAVFNAILKLRPNTQ